MTPGDWLVLALVGVVTLLAISSFRIARSVDDLTDQLEHDHDTRWHYDDPPETDPRSTP